MIERAWTRRALCAEVGWAFFYPGEDHEDGLREQARQTCRLCPVQRQCMEYALACEWGEPSANRWGVWAGMGPAARTRIEQQWRVEGRTPVGAKEPWERRFDLAVARGEAFDDSRVRPGEGQGDGQGAGESAGEPAGDDAGDEDAA